MSKRLEALVRALQTLPGVGVKSASRMAYHLLGQDRHGALGLAKALEQACAEVLHCDMCHTLSDQSICTTCADPRRDATVVCVVETPADQAAVEKTGQFMGRYFVLMGKINPLGAVGLNHAALQALVHRLQADGQPPVTELILATNFTAEGEAAAHLIGEIVKPLGVKVTRLARGVPIGSELEFVDLGTIAHAFSDRR